MLKPLAKTPDYLVELGHARGYGYLLTIARKTDGHCVAFYGRLVGESFREAVKRYGVQQTIESYLRIAGDSWEPLYKASAIQRMLEATE